MSNTTIQISIESYFNTVVGIIANDLIIQKHLSHLRQSGLDTTPLHIQLHKHIFTLAGLTNVSVTDELVEWYFQKAEQANELDLIDDREKLLNLSTEIMRELVQARQNETQPNIAS